MSSRDGSNRTSGPRRSPQSERQNNQRANWDVDPAEIDRYLSGRPSRDEESQTTTGRARPARNAPDGTADQLDQLQRARREQPRQSSQQRPSRPLSAGRQQFVEPEYEDDDFDDGLDEDAPVNDRYQGRGEAYYDDQEPTTAAPVQRPRREQPVRREAQPQRRTRQSQRQPGQQRPATTRQPTYDDGYDEELYADDPYLTYDQEDDWKAPATRRPARERPQVKLNKPNLPKFSMPQALTQSELSNDIPSLAMIGGAILGTIIMAIVVSNRLDMLPGTIPTHVSASGVQENLRGRNAMWNVPLLVTAISLMNIAAAWFFARIDMFAARFILAAALVAQFVAWVAVLNYLWP